MIASALKELRESAKQDLPAWIDAVAGAQNVELERGFTVYDWWPTATEKLRLSWPALSITWQGSSTSVRGSNGRRSVHRVIVSYGFRAADSAAIQRHILHIPEALLRWLDEFPTMSERPGEDRAILAVAIASDGRSAGAIDIVHGPAFEDKELGALVWAVDLEFNVLTHDAPLPALVST